MLDSSVFFILYSPNTISAYEFVDLYLLASSFVMPGTKISFGFKEDWKQQKKRYLL